MILGTGNVVLDKNDIEVDSGIDEEPSVEQRHSWLFDLKEEVNHGMKTIQEEIRDVTEGIRRKFAEKFHHKFTDDMRKQFEEKFHSQSKLKEMNLEKLKKMKPSDHRL